MTPCLAGLNAWDAFAAHPAWAVAAILAVGWGVASIIKASRAVKP